MRLVVFPSKGALVATGKAKAVISVSGMIGIFLYEGMTRMYRAVKSKQKELRRKSCKIKKEMAEKRRKLEKKLHSRAYK